MSPIKVKRLPTPKVISSRVVINHVKVISPDRVVISPVKVVTSVKAVTSNARVVTSVKAVTSSARVAFSPVPAVISPAISSRKPRVNNKTLMPKARQ